jgi:hypothetical protein
MQHAKIFTWHIFKVPHFPLLIESLTRTGAHVLIYKGKIPIFILWGLKPSKKAQKLKKGAGTFGLFLCKNFYRMREYRPMFVTLFNCNIED